MKPLAKYIVQTREIKRIGLTSQLGINCVEHIQADALKMFGHVIDIPELTAELTERLLRLEGVIAIHPVQTFSIPKPRIAQGPYATLDDTLADVGYNLPGGPFTDPGYDGGAGSGVQTIFGSVDTGVNENHNDSNTDWCFKTGVADINAPKPGESRLKEHYDPFDQPMHPHGTWTTEITARSPRADGAWKGAAYKALIYDARALDYNGQGTTTTVTNALNWLVQKAALYKVPMVVNMSLGGPHDSFINEAVHNAWVMGVIVCAAAGNSGRWPPDCDASVNSPGDADDALCFGATTIVMQDQNNAPPKARYVQTWSSRGPRTLDGPVPFYVVAPGFAIEPGFNDAPNSGTSFAAPHGSGLCLALVHKAVRLYPNYTKQQIVQLVRSAIVNSAISLGYDTSGNHTPEGAYCIQGHGYIQAHLAYAAIGGTPPPPPPPPPQDKYAPSSWQGPFSIAGAPPPPPPPPETYESSLTGQFTKTSYQPNETVACLVKLTDPASGAGLANRTLAWSYANKNGSVTTDLNGAATINFTDPTPGNYMLAVIFGGD